MEMQVSVTAKGGIFEGKAPEIMNQEMTAAMVSVTRLLEREIQSRTPEGVSGTTHGLRATIAGDVVNRGTPIVKGIVVTHSKYGEVIEKGRGAGKNMPPKGSLIRWIEVKMKKKDGTSFTEIEAKRIEFVVRRKIGKKGFTKWPDGAKMFEESLDKNWSRIQGIFDNRGFHIARRLN